MEAYDDEHMINIYCKSVNVQDLTYLGQSGNHDCRQANLDSAADVKSHENCKTQLFIFFLETKLNLKKIDFVENGSERQRPRKGAVLPEL